MTVLKICCSEWNNESRDKRELSVCQELGIKTLVMAKGKSGDKYKHDLVSGFDVLRFSTQPLGNKIYKGLNQIISLFMWAHYARKLKPDIISGHDISGLTIGWMSNWFRADKAKLIYDSHEFEIGRNANRSKLQRWGITHLERLLIKKCVFPIMVNDVIADEVQKIHKLEKRPVVVRSTPNFWAVDDTVTQIIHTKYCDALNIPNDSFIVMYHGGVMKDRGIETLLEVVAKSKNITAVILGNGDKKYLDSLKDKARELGVEKSVLFHEAVPIDELWKYVGAANLGMILAPAIEPNHLFSLPNKFFENIQSETPIICPEYPAMKPIIEKYKIGMTCDPTNISEIVDCVERMRRDKKFYSNCKTNIKIAKQDLCWEKEKEKLIKSYNILISNNK